jgi:hypothetical protein
MTNMHWQDICQIQVSALPNSGKEFTNYIVMGIGKIM